jgi:hypothetical protein
MTSVARGMLLDVNLLRKSAKILCLAKQRERVVKQASESWLEAGGAKRILKAWRWFGLAFLSLFRQAQMLS